MERSNNRKSGKKTFGAEKTFPLSRPENGLVFWVLSEANSACLTSSDDAIGWGVTEQIRSSKKVEGETEEAMKVEERFPVEKC